MAGVTALAGAIDVLPEVEGASMRALVGSMEVVAVFDEDAVRDIDTPDDL